MTVSLGGPEGCHQILVHFDWKEQSADEIAREAARLLKTDPSQWPDIVWYGEKCILRSRVLPGVKSIDVRHRSSACCWHLWITVESSETLIVHCGEQIPSKVVGSQFSQLLTIKDTGVFVS